MLQSIEQRSNDTVEIRANSVQHNKSCDPDSQTVLKELVSKTNGEVITKSSLQSVKSLASELAVNSYKPVPKLIKE